MADNSTINDVLCCLTSVRSRAPKDNFVPNAVVFYTSDAFLKDLNTILSVCKQKPITRKACVWTILSTLKHIWRNNIYKLYPVEDH